MGMGLSADQGNDAHRLPGPALGRSLALVGLAGAVLLSSGCVTTGPLDYVRNGFKVGPNYCKPPAPVAKDWIDAVYGSSSNLLSGVYLNYEQDTGQYVAAFGSGNKGVLMVCKSSALGEQASRSCEGPLLRMVKAWGQVLGG